MFKVELAPQAKRDIRRAANSDYQRIREKMRRLIENPRPPGCAKLTDSYNRFRLRVGDWRILYSIDDDRNLVTIHRIVKRDKAYN